MCLDVDFFFIYVFNILFVPVVSVIQQMLIFNMSKLKSQTKLRSCLCT